MARLVLLRGRDPSWSIGGSASHRPAALAMSHPPSSLASRAFDAVALLIGFYVLALSIAAFLCWWPFQFVDVPLKLVVLSLAGAGLILWSILPRIDRFEEPGARLTPEMAPRLFAEIESMARETGQSMPEQVFLVGDMNAFVTERGGVMGIGSKRVMGIGLPLLHTLDVGEFRAVVAHEFGHFHGGDTKLGPWIYKTRTVIGRTIQNLRKSDSMFLHWPFMAYGGHFLRTTQAISQEQEYAADRLAATITGSRALTGGLAKVARTGPAFDQYWASEFAPLLERGLRPPLLVGFRRFVAHPDVVRVLDEHEKARASISQADPLDSHPSLAERFAAVSDLPEVVGSHPAAPASTLLDDVDEMELVLLRFALSQGSSQAPVLETISWDDACRLGLIPSFEALCRAQTRFLAGRTVESLSELPARLEVESEKVAFPQGQPDVETRHEIGARIIDIAFALALHRAGWQLSTEPGGPVEARRDDETILPLGHLARLRDDAVRRQGWPAECARLGIGALSLEVPEATG